MDAERALLGALLIDPDAINRIPLLAPEDFNNLKCRLVYEAILAAPASDFVLVSEQMERMGTLQVVGTAFLTALALHCPTSLHAPHYAQAVADAAAKRRQAAPAHSLSEALGL